MEYQTLAIIPARGGSKGIARKNVQPLAGKPLVAHTIEHAQKARSVNHVVVSTDDAEIAAVSELYGCSAPQKLDTLLTNSTMVQERCTR